MNAKPERVNAKLERVHVKSEHINGKSKRVRGLLGMISPNDLLRGGLMLPVIVRSADSLRNDIEAGPHRMIADEPVSAGGTELGPTPYDFLAAALGTCTSMTMRVVANRENIPLEGVEITIENDRMHAKDCADCLSTSGFIHRFNVA